MRQEIPYPSSLTCVEILLVETKSSRWSKNCNANKMQGMQMRVLLWFRQIAMQMQFRLICLPKGFSLFLAKRYMMNLCPTLIVDPSTSSSSFVTTAFVYYKSTQIITFTKARHPWRHIRGKYKYLYAQQLRGKRGRRIIIILSVTTHPRTVLHFNVIHEGVREEPTIQLKWFILLSRSDWRLIDRVTNKTDSHLT